MCGTVRTCARSPAGVPGDRRRHPPQCPVRTRRTGTGSCAGSAMSLMPANLDHTVFDEVHWCTAAGRVRGDPAAAPLATPCSWDRRAARPTWWRAGGRRPQPGRADRGDAARRGLPLPGHGVRRRLAAPRNGHAGAPTPAGPVRCSRPADRPATGGPGWPWDRRTLAEVVGAAHRRVAGLDRPVERHRAGSTAAASAAGPSGSCTASRHRPSSPPSCAAMTDGRPGPPGHAGRARPGRRRAAAALLRLHRRAARRRTSAPLRGRPTPRGLYLVYEGYLIERLGAGRRRRAAHRPVPQRPQGDHDRAAAAGRGCSTSSREAGPAAGGAALPGPRAPRRGDAGLHPLPGRDAGDLRLLPARRRARASAATSTALRTAADGLRRCPLGAGAVAGTDLPIDPARTARAARLRRAGPRTRSTRSPAGTRRCGCSAAAAGAGADAQPARHRPAAVEHRGVRLRDVPGPARRRQLGDAAEAQRVPARARQGRRPAVAIGAWTAAASGDAGRRRSPTRSRSAPRRWRRSGRA